MRLSRLLAAASFALALAPPMALGQDSATKSQPALTRKNILGTETKIYSQSKEELIIRDFFQDRRNGFFLDVGCAWPMKYNNTYYLESRLGWRGIGVDGLPEYAPLWAKHRKRSRFFNYIVTDHSGTIETFYRSEHLDISSARPRPGPGGHAVKYQELRVPTMTLTRLLEQAGVSRIDFLSMDIEGHEPLALAGFDIERFRPELACVEAHIENRKKIVAYFAAHGYERIDRYLAYDEVNYYFTPKASAP